jgi:hypothetical protein
MHNIADFMNHVLAMPTGKHDGSNVKNFVKKCNQFPGLWVKRPVPVTPPPSSPHKQRLKKGKHDRENVNAFDNLQPTP